MIMGTEGGIMMPRVPPADEMAPAKPGVYRWRTMAGIMIDPMAATVGGPEPEIAAKNMHASTVTMARPPYVRPMMGMKMATIRFESPPCSMIPPARMNKGMAISGNELSASNIFCAKSVNGMSE